MMHLALYLEAGTHQGGWRHPDSSEQITGSPLKEFVTKSGQTDRSYRVANPAFSTQLRLCLAYTHNSPWTSPLTQQFSAV